jgi:hypothetical protein
MIKDLRQDYRAMGVMIFGAAPQFDDILGAIAGLEDRLNAAA